VKESGELVNRRKYLVLPLAHHHGPLHVHHGLLRLIYNNKGGKRVRSTGCKNKRKLRHASTATSSSPTPETATAT